jgi:SAM-dependent methyltransferase
MGRSARYLRLTMRHSARAGRATAALAGIAKPRSRRAARPLVGFLPSFEPFIVSALRLAGLCEDEMLYDLGSGDGRVLVVAATKFHARAVGIELSSELVRRSRQEVANAGLSDRIRIVSGDARRMSLRDADVVFMFLSPPAHAELGAKLKSELRLGARVVTLAFPMPGWSPTKRIELMGTSIYLFEPPG